MSLLVLVEGYISIWDPRCGEQDGAVFDGNDLIGILHPVFTFNEAYLIVCPAVVGHLGLLPGRSVNGGDVEDVEMTDLAGVLVFEKLVDFGAERAENLCVEIFYRGCRHMLQKSKLGNFLRNDRGCG